MGSRAFNSPIVIRIAHQHRGHSSGTRGLHIKGSISHVPDSLVRCVAKICQCHQNGCWVRFIGRRVARTDHRTEEPGPAKMDHLATQKSAGLVRDDSLRPGGPGLQHVWNTRHCGDMVQVLFSQRIIENVASMLPPVAKHDRKALAKRNTNAIFSVFNCP